MKENCKCKCPACGAEKPMIESKACTVCECGASLEKVCEAAPDELEDTGSCCGGSCG